MKPLKDLKAGFASEDIGKLLDYVKAAPVELPEGIVYFFEKQGNIVHVYGVERGIREYKVGQMVPGMTFMGARKTSQGEELSLAMGEVEKIILHTDTYNGPIVAGRPFHSTASDYTTGRTPSSSSPSSSSESRGSGESR